MKQAFDAEKENWSSLQSKLEKQIEDALNLNRNLQTEIERARQQQRDTEDHLQEEIGRAVRQNEDNEWKTRYENLERAQQQLQGELRQQQTVTREVRQEAQSFLGEMKTLSERSNQASDREEKLVQQVHRLEDDLREWKGRYAHSKSQQSNLSSSSPGSSVKQPDVSQTSKNAAFMQKDGILKQVHVAKFQVAVDALLATARQGEPQSVLAQVKAVVIAVRNITQDSANASNLDNGQLQQKNKIGAKLSATANNLITAVKNFSASNGLLPISLLDAAASHLSLSVIEMIRLVKMSPSAPGEVEEDDDNSLIAESPAAYYGEYGRMSTGGESVYSMFSQDHAPPVPPISQAGQSIKSGGNHQPYQNGLPRGTTPGFNVESRGNEADELKVSDWLV